MNELVSVITITKNRAKVIQRAIESVLGQTYKNIEHIIIDGASGDDTESVVRKNQDERIKYFKLETDLPPVKCLDLAFEKSKGKYITFLDDDDEYLPHKIEKQITLLKSLPKEFGFVYCWMDYYDDKKLKIIKEWHPIISGNVYLDQIEKQSIGGTPTLFIKREVFEQSGGWNKKLNYVADWEFTTRLSKNFLVDFVPEVLVKVHTNHMYERMMSRKSDDKKISALIEFHNYYLTEFKDGFLVKPKAKISHLISLSNLYKSKSEYFLALKFLFKIIRLNFFSVVWIKQTAKLFIRQSE